MMMNPSTIKIVAIALCVLQTPTTSLMTGEGPHFHPIYTYSCNEDFSVTFRGVSGKIRLLNESDNQISCRITEVPNHNGNFRLSHECMLNINGSVGNDTINEDRIAYISVYDKSEGENIPPTTAASTTSSAATSSDTLKTTSATTSTATSAATSTATSPNKPSSAPSRRKRDNGKIATGHHIFKITCKAIPNNGIQRVALAETGIKEFEELKNYNEIGRVEMRFKEGDSQNFPDISEAYLGDTFFMYLNYLGDTKEYSIVPQICTAYKGTYRTTGSENNQFVLYNKTITGCITREASNYNVMENFTRKGSTVVSAKMHAFRFTSASNGGEETDVTIACKVRICSTSNSPATECQLNSCTARSRRKRRAANTHILDTVLRTIKVRTELNFAEANRGPTWILVPLVGCIIKWIS